MDDKYEYEQPDLTWNQSPIDEMLEPQLEYDAYPDADRESLLTNKQIVPAKVARDPRSRNPENFTEEELEIQRSRKKNLSDEIQSLSPIDYKNVYAARNRLLNDLNELPSDILRQTFEKNKALRQSRDSKFDEKNGKEVEKKEAKSVELPETLWDLESEKELEDRENGYYRGKRDTTGIKGIPKVTSTGLLLKPLTVTKSKNAIDLVFATYWLLPKLGAQILTDKDIDCINKKMQNSASSKDNYQSMDKSKLQDIFTKMCLEERGILSNSEVKPSTENDDLKRSPYYNQIAQLTLGQMTVYRIRLEFKCEILLSGERCAQILDEQNWSSYLGKLGTGYFNIH